MKIDKILNKHWQIPSIGLTSLAVFIGWVFRECYIEGELWHLVLLGIAAGLVIASVCFNTRAAYYTGQIDAYEDMRRFREQLKELKK